MSAGLSDLDHFASLLQSFADHLSIYCRRCKSDNHFLGGTPDLFEYVIRLGEGTSLYLDRTLTENQGQHKATTRIRGSRKAERVLRRVSTVNRYWSLLHSQLKRAADAHTLAVPVPLVNMASDYLSRIHGLEKVKLVILQTPHFMYYQQPQADIREAATELATIIPQAKFDILFGLIELPYSQAPSLFTNTVLFHELGHVVFDIVCKQSVPGSLVSTLKGRLSTLIPVSTDTLTQSYAHKALLTWAEEMFSDLFALHLIGPAFSFGLLDLYALLGYAHDSPAMTEFVPSHPAPAYRFKTHFDTLKRLGWPLDSQALANSHSRFMKELAGIKNSEYKYRQDNTVYRLAPFDRFFDLVPVIQAEVEKITEKVTSRGDRFTSDYKDIALALENGIVPSVTWRSRKPELMDRVIVINAAYHFLLTGLNQLVETVRSKPELDTRPKRLSFWRTRLESWTLKALDDYSLLARSNTTGEGK